MRARPAGRAARLGVFDLGLAAEQRAGAVAHADVVVAPDWHHEFLGRDAAPGWLCGLLARRFLREHFPGADVYLWLDADAFVLDWGAIYLFVRGASARGPAMVSELDRGSRFQYGSLPACHRDIARWYDAAFGPAVAEELQSYPVLIAGAFALHRDAPHWDAWAIALARAVRHVAHARADQTALNFAVYKLGLFARTELLPAWCNWGCAMGLPAWDLAAQRLVEPYLPHAPVGILHRRGPDKGEVVHVPRASGGSAPVRLRFPPRLALPE